VENLPQDPYERGIMLKQKGDLSGALQAFQEAIPNKQNTARYQVALLYEELHQRENAIKELLQVVQENPNWIEPRIKLGLLYQLSGRKDIARKIWEQVLAVAEEDTALNYSKLEEQLALLEKMVNAGKVKLDEKPLISLKNFPKLPWIWILILIVVGGIVVLIRVISNWRLNKMMRLALEEEDTEVKEAKIKEEILVEEPVEKSPASARSEDLEDEKQQLIYDLVQKKYTIAEIAKMLNIGQEEVKFILDFRSKGEIKGKKLKI
jgi:tetratricopeptide (TPR) repeat protein